MILILVLTLILGLLLPGPGARAGGGGAVLLELGVAIALAMEFPLESLLVEFAAISQHDFEDGADHGRDLVIGVHVVLGGEVDVLLTDVDQLSVQVVPHPDRDVDRLLFPILMADLQQLALACFLHPLLHEEQEVVLVLVSDVDVPHVEVDLYLRALAVVPLLQVVVEDLTRSRGRLPDALLLRRRSACIHSYS